jgi:hypothetical protein
MKILGGSILDAVLIKFHACLRRIQTTITPDYVSELKAY